MGSMNDPLLRPVRPFKWKRNRKPLSLEITKTYRALVLVLLFLGLSSTGTYLYINSLSPAKGYELKQLQVDHELLQSDLRKLERRAIEAQSFIELQGSSIFEKMEIAETHDFSYVKENSLAETHDSSVLTDD